MAKNIALRIKIEIVETEVEPSSDQRPHEQADGAFSLVLPEADELNISSFAQSNGPMPNFKLPIQIRIQSQPVQDVLLYG